MPLFTQTLKTTLRYVCERGKCPFGFFRSTFSLRKVSEYGPWILITTNLLRMLNVAYHTHQVIIASDVNVYKTWNCIGLKLHRWCHDNNMWLRVTWVINNWLDILKFDRFLVAFSKYFFQCLHIDISSCLVFSELSSGWQIIINFSYRYRLHLFYLLE